MSWKGKAIKGVTIRAYGPGPDISTFPLRLGVEEENEHPACQVYVSALQQVDPL